MPLAKLVAQGIYQCPLPTGFPIGDVHVYLLPDKEGLTIVDTGSHRDDAEEKLALASHELGYSLADIHTILLTHGHADHVGNVKLLFESAKAEVLGHPLASNWLHPSADWLQKEEDFFDRLYTESGLDEADKSRLRKERKWLRGMVPPQELSGCLEEGQSLGDWQVLHTPGHSKASVSFYRKQDQLLIAGDVLIGHVSANAFVEPDADDFSRIPSVEQFEGTFTRLLALPLAKVLSGHGVVIKDPQPLMMRRIEAHERRVGQLVDIVRAGSQTVREMASVLFPGRLSELMLIVSEIIGHLDVAVERRLLRRFYGEKGELVYEVV